MESMFKILNQNELTAFYLSEPRLVEHGLPDDEQEHLRQFGTYKMNPRSEYFGYFEDDTEDMKAVVQFEGFSQTALAIHCRMRTRFQGSQTAERVLALIRKSLQGSSIHRLISFVPKCCVPARRCLERLGFERECELKDSMVWRGKIENLYLYSVEATCQQQ